MLQWLLFPCVRCSMGTPRAAEDCHDSYATDGETQHARTSLSRPNQHFKTLVSAFDGDEHDCSGTVSDSALQAHEHLPTASSLVERRWRSLLHGKQHTLQDIPDGAAPSGTMPASTSSTHESVDGGSQWSASSGSDQSLSSWVRILFL